MKRAEQLADNLGAVGWRMEEADYELLSDRGSRVSKLFDYTFSMFGMKYAEIKIDKMIDDSLKLS
jgi:hypothetical protein